MKITFLLTQDLSSPSGLGRYFPWAKELVKLGHDVRVIALHPDYEGLTTKHVIQDGVTVDYVAQMHVKKSGSTKTYFSPFQLIWIALIGIIKLTAVAMAESADCVIIGKPHPMNGIAGLIIKLLRPHTRTILDIDDYEAGSNRFQFTWQKRLIAWFENTIPRFAQTITCNTYFNIYRLENQGIPVQKMLYLPNGIDPDRFQIPDPVDVQKLRKSLVLDDRKVVAYIGSMSLANHAVDLLLKAFVQVKVKISDACLLLVGGGEDLEKLHQLSKDLGIADAVIFTGRIPSDVISKYYAMSDASVDPVYDNDAARGRCPLKMFESWACGVPFITGNVGDRVRLIGNPPAGLIVLPGDVADLSDGIIRVLEIPENGEVMRNRGLLAVTDFQWDKLVHQFSQKMVLL